MEVRSLDAGERLPGLQHATRQLCDFEKLLNLSVPHFPHLQNENNGLFICVPGHMVSILHVSV